MREPKQKKLRLRGWIALLPLGLLAAALLAPPELAQAQIYYDPAMAYDPENNRYLAVHSEYDSTIHGWLIDHAGNHVAEFSIGSSATLSGEIAVAYDTLYERYLVVWAQRSGSIYGQLVSADGTLVEMGLLYIASAGDRTNEGTTIAVAYDSANHRFLVAYVLVTDRWKLDIYGRLVNADGTMSGGSLVISERDTEDEEERNHPAVAYDGANQRFLVVWDQHIVRSTDPWVVGIDIYGQLVNGDGTLNGGNFVVGSNEPNEQEFPSVAYDGVNQRFLVVWQEWNVVEGYRTDADIRGTVLGDGSVLPISTAAKVDQMVPSVAYDPVKQRYLVAWEDRRVHRWGDIFGQFVEADGTFDGGNFALANESTWQRYPAVAYNSNCASFMAAYDDGTGTIAFAPVGGCLIVNSTADGQDTNPGDGACFTGSNILRNGQPEPECTLRAAIETANATPDEDTITFDIPGAPGIPLIEPNAALPAITQPVVIDGSTQPGSGEIWLDGSNAGAATRGLRIESHTTLKALSIGGFGGPGTYIAAGNLTFVGASDPVSQFSQISGNGEAGIHHSGNGALLLAGTIKVSNNCHWGVWSDALSPTGDILLTVAGDLKVSNNGQGAGCQGGGIHTRTGLIGPAAATLDVTDSNGNGIESQAQNNLVPSAGLLFEGVQKILRNNGWGIDSSGSVAFGGTPSDPGQVNSNALGGVLAQGDVVFAYAQVKSNGGWGVDTDGDVTMRNVTIEDNAGGGVRSSGVLNMGSEDLLVIGNGGDGIRILGVDETIIPAFSAQLIDAAILENQGHGIFVGGSGTFFAGRLTSNNNRADGVNVAADADIRDSEICGNQGLDLVIGGSQNLQNVEYGSACDQDEDGVRDEVEAGAGDGNGDGIPDNLQPHVASLPNAKDGRYVTLESAEGTTLADVQATADPVPGTPPPTPQGLNDFPLGFFSFKVQGLSPGSATTVKLFCPAGVNPSTYWKYGPTPDNTTAHWYEFLFDGTTGAQLGSNPIILHFVDAQRGDADLSANGEIVEPGGPAQPGAPGGTAGLFRVERMGNVFADGSFNCGLPSDCFNVGSAADLAERINVSEPVEPGDVVELDPDNPKSYRKVRSAYSTLVAGVISTAPGITLGNRSRVLPLFQDPLQLPFRVSLSDFAERATPLAMSLSLPGLRDGPGHRSVASTLLSIRMRELLAVQTDAPMREGEALLALLGRVPVKVTAENGPIQPGDLLVSASTPSYAMRCGDVHRCEGAIIGKALEPLEQGTAIIQMLVAR